MNALFTNANFHFRRIEFKKYHYTNNLSGSPENYIAYMLSGSTKIASAEKKISVKADDVFFIPKGLPYESHWFGDNITFLSFGFSDIEAEESIGFALQAVDCDSKQKTLIKQIPVNQPRLSCDALGKFYTALSALIPNLKQSRSISKQEVLLKKAKAYIKSNTACSVADIARHCYISEPYLYLIFKELSNSTPNDYRIKCKCIKGTEYLLTTDKTVEEISEKTGFSSAAHFRRALKKHTGLTPHEIRQKNSFVL